MTAEFCDSNVLIYAYDITEPRKHEIAKQLVMRLWSDGTGALSTQVLSEFFVNITRKVAHPLSISTAEEVIADFGNWRVQTLTVASIRQAVRDLVRPHGISFWDALILQAARDAGAAIMWSEDLQTGRSFYGVQIQNPFA